MSSNTPPLSPKRTISINIDDSFSFDERKSIVRAIRTWNRSLNNNMILLTSNSKADRRIVRASSDDPIVDVAKKESLAITASKKYIYVISDRIGDVDLSMIMLHEIGHMLGAGHANRGLMSPTFRTVDYKCIDYDTAKQIALANDLDVNTMNYCF